MNFLQQFIIFLLSQKPEPSFLTAKNYKADISQFINWFEEKFRSPFDPSRVTMQVFQEYKKARNLSKKSMDRHTSSLRKFFNFLKMQRVSSLDLFPTQDYKKKIEADPWMIRNFKSFLYEYKKSNLTIKNYVNDVKNFFAWLEEVALVKYVWDVADKNLLDKINTSIIAEYKQRLIEAKFSPRTINRKLSSLRSYVGWAKSQGFISSGHAEFTSTSQPTRIKNEIREQAEDPQGNVQSETVTYSPFPPKRLMQKSIKGLNSLFDNLLILPIAQTLETMQRLFWKVTGKKIFKKTTIIQHDEISNIRREFYAPLSISTHYLPIPKRIWHYIYHTRPNWYKKYHSYSFTHYFHFAILVMLASAIGFGMYNEFFPDTQKQNAVLGIVATPSPRILSFQGKITDSSEIPITGETTILFSLYDDENASSEAALWQESNIVKPDLDGVFSVSLGKKTPITDAILSRNSKLFLGITIGNGPELQPRQELATVSLASNAETLRGLEPITNTTKVANVVLALDSSGNLSIAGEKTHTFQIIGGQFVLSGKALSLNTALGSNGNIEIVPDGIGKIDLSRPIQNSSNNNNLTSAMGSVEFDDTVAILATTSAQAALYINQNSTGILISANTNDAAKFVLESDGTGRFTGDLGVNGGDLTSTATTFNLLNSTVTALNIGGAATKINIGVSGGTTTVKSNLTIDKDFILSSLSSNGGILYANGSGKIFQTSSGSSSDCFTGGSSPSFTPCSKIFNQVATVGIGTTTPAFRLDVWDSQDATAAAQIYNASISNSATGLVVKLGNAPPINSTPSGHFIDFETEGIGSIGGILRNGDGQGITYVTNRIADFAEYIKKDKSETIEYGSVVCLKNNGLAVKCDNDNNKIIGVASEYPAFLGGKNLGDGSIAVGMIGQVETLVAIPNGEIKAGDILTASEIPGVAVKTTKPGQTIGKILENLTIIDESKVAGYYDPDNKEYRSKTGFPNISLKSNIVRVVKIPVLVNVSWYDPDVYLAQNGNLTIDGTNLGGYSISNPLNETLTNIGGFFEVVAANIKAGLIDASQVVADSLIVTTDSIIINGQNLKDYIVSVVKDSGIIKSEIISPVVNTNQLFANIISPLSSSSLIVKLATPSGSLIVENASGSAVARIDDQGNASFSGTINSLSLETNNASISGTLRAGNIVADSILGLEAKVSSITADYLDIASYSAQLSYVPDFAAERAQFNQGLMVFGSTSLYDLSVVERLSIGGTMFIVENSIETLGADLSLQSLRLGGLSLMGGLVYIDTEGNVKVQNDLFVKGSLAVNTISPLPTSDLVINNASGSSILSINQAGNIVASGSGTFSKLNFSLIQPVLAVSATEVVASSSAGITSITPYQSEITIRNPLVTSMSIIYITPVGTPSAQTPFLMRQTPQGSFTVGVQSPTNRPIDFNWLIVN